jgi:hypothetical protein
MDHPIFVIGDFNGVFGDLLCLSHDDTCTTADGTEIPMQAGMIVTAFDKDWDDDLGDCYLLASGVVEPSPRELACLGSKWCLRIDGRGCRHQATLSA